MRPIKILVVEDQKPWLDALVAIYKAVLGEKGLVTPLKVA